MRLLRGFVATLVIGLVTASPALAHGKPATARQLRRALEGLVHAEGGPPGAILTLHRDGRTTVIAAGRANVRHPGAPRADEHMRLASVAKAYSAAVILHLAGEKLLGLDDTIARWLPTLPTAWGAVTLRELLDHTSGLPDYTQSAGFRQQFETDPRDTCLPRR